MQNLAEKFNQKTTENLVELGRINKEKADAIFNDVVSIIEKATEEGRYWCDIDFADIKSKYAYSCWMNDLTKRLKEEGFDVEEGLASPIRVKRDYRVSWEKPKRS